MNRMRNAFLAAAASILVTGAAAAAPAAPAPAAAHAGHGQAQAQAQRDWTQTIVATPEGGFRMGNPDAAVKLVEYVSLTCPHCRNFARDGEPTLVSEHVRSGRVSFEVRPFPLDIVAQIGAQLQRCVEPAHAFALQESIFAGQDALFARLDHLVESDVRAINALAPGEQRVRIASLAGLDAIAAQHGLDAARSRACLADQAGADRVAAIKAAAEAIGVSGTPSFTVNGVLAQETYDWESLRPLLAQRP